MSVSYTNLPKKTYKIDGDGDVQKLLEELKMLIDNLFILPEKFKTVKISYNAKKGLGSPGDKSYWPVRFISDDTELWLSTVTTGSKDFSSKAIIKALKLMGFETGKNGKQIILTYKNVNTIFKK